MTPLSRRDFIRVVGVSALGLAVACGKDRDPARLITDAASLDAVIDGRNPGAQMHSGGFETLAGESQRVVFGLTNPTTGDFLTGGSANLWAATSRSAPALGPFPATFRGEGLGTRGAYVVDATFPADGTYLLLAEAIPAGATAAIVAAASTPLQVGRVTKMPLPGDRAPSIQTPTTERARGVDPICTRTPPCSMHTASLDQALRSGKPTVFIIATPKYCQSALCGPEVDIIQQVSQEFAGRASFIHAEVLANDDDETVQRFFPLSPASTAWKVEQEPAIWFIDAAGTISERIIGPLDLVETREHTQALVSA